MELKTFKLLIAIAFIVHNIVAWKTERKPNISACYEKSDLYDKHKSYLKSACRITTELDYYQAEAACIENGMNLFVIDSQRTKLALFDFANTVWPAYHGALLWISRENMFNATTEDEEMCEIISNMFGLFRLEEFNCNRAMTFFCEYLR